MTNFYIQEKVQTALSNKQPVLALESTIITHGLPWPDNFDLSIEVQEIASSLGVTPAIFAVIDGKIRVGLEEDEIKGIVDQGLKDKAIEKQESELVHGALNFDDIVIRSVMTPRTKMFTLNSKTILFEALPQINQSGFSRIPIHGDNKDEIIGIIHVRDVLKALEDDKKKTYTLEKISRKPIFVSQEKMVSDLLKEMQGRQTHMAIVIDEFGGVEGCVTLEDLLEEIVGEIHDEKDKVQQVFQSEGNDSILTDGDIEIDKINEIFKTNIPEGDDYSRLNGLLHEKLRDIPKEGDKIEIESIRIMVEKVEKNKPEKIRIEKIK